LISRPRVVPIRPQPKWWVIRIGGNSQCTLFPPIRISRQNPKDGKNGNLPAPSIAGELFLFESFRASFRDAESKSRTVTTYVEVLHEMMPTSCTSIEGTFFHGERLKDATPFLNGRVSAGLARNLRDSVSSRDNAYPRAGSKAAINSTSPG
jgi:hypothetical protein